MFHERNGTLRFFSTFVEKEVFRENFPNFDFFMMFLLREKVLKVSEH